MKKEFPILYKYTSKKQKQQWQIFVDGDSFYTEEGIVGGKISRSLPTQCEGKNVGKKSETTPEEQAIKEAEAKWQKKKDKGGYAEDIEESGKDYFSPMLAHTLEEDLDFESETYFIQPKLDGLRADNYMGRITSREGKEFKVPHLWQFDDECRLDGELYSHAYHDDFNEIVSMCKGDPDEAKIAEIQEKLEYWVYDLPSKEGTFSERYEALQKWVDWLHETHPHGDKFVLVPTYQIKSMDELWEKHEEFKALGFEGSIVRADKEYEVGKRSKYLLKVKDWMDSEFIIKGFLEGKGGRKGTIGKFILQHDKYPDEEFKCNVKGDFSYLREVWSNRDNYIGKTATVKYFNRTPRKNGKGDVPRFGYVIKIAREDYE